MRALLPASLPEALAAKASHPALVPMAGGTDLLAGWPGALERHERSYLDLSGVADLRAIRWTAESLEIGAMTTYWDTLSDARIGEGLPLLHEAARRIGALQIQTRGTWAGNVANGSPVADGVVALMAYDATIVSASSTGERTIPLSSLYRGYGELDLRPNELICRIAVPLRKRRFAMFEKVAPRRAQAIAALSVAAVDGEDGWRVVVGGMAPTVRRCPALEDLLLRRAEAGTPDDLLAAIRRDCSAIDDVRGTSRYREQVLARVLFHALRARAAGLR